MPGYATYKGYDFCWVLPKIVCKLWTIADKMSDINIAVVLLQENVLAYLVSANG
jgi:hypothetical protein